MAPWFLAFWVLASGWVFSGVTHAQMVPKAANLPNTVTWTTTVSNLRGQNGQPFAFLCPPNGAAIATVWGTDVYTDDSAVCIAAVHAGVIMFSTGGPIVIEIRPGQSSYTGTTRNGVVSTGYGGWSGSFVFVTEARSPQGRSYTAQPRGPGEQVLIIAYGKDETDGSDVSWNALYPNPSFDDDPARKGLPNARWQGAHSWDGTKLCLSIKNLEAPYPPAHTLAVGYTVTLTNGTFEDGSTTKTFVLYRYSGVPAQKEMTQCVATQPRTGGFESAQMLSVVWAGQDADYVGEWGNGRPDGRKDGHFQLSFNAGLGVAVKSVAVFSADAAGTPQGGQVWHSAASNYWMLGVFQGGRQINTSHVPTLGTFAGPITLDLYANDSGWFKQGNYFLVEVLLENGGRIKKVVQLEAVAPVGRSYTAQPRTPEVMVPPATGAVTWDTTAAALRGKNGQQFTYACPAGGTPKRVWGTDVYTDDSSICTAAVHTGRIIPSIGGTVTIEIRPGQPSYVGTGRNGILSESYGAWTGSFVFIGAGGPPHGRSYTAQPRQAGDPLKKEEPLKKEFDDSLKKMLKP